MQKILISLILTLSFNATAEIATSRTTRAASERSFDFSVSEFLRTFSAENKEWPKKLTLEDTKPISLEEFHKRLENRRWNIHPHCDGQRVLPASGYSYLEYKKGKVHFYTWNPKRKVYEQDCETPYQVRQAEQSETNNKSESTAFFVHHQNCELGWRIINGEKRWAKLADHVVIFQRVKENGEFVLNHLSNTSDQIYHCEDGRTTKEQVIYTSDRGPSS